MGEYERRGVDGCATFYRSSKFSLVEKHTVEFQQIAMQRPELRRTEDVFNRVMVKDNIGLIVVLESKEVPNQRLIVVNTHLHWDPADSDVKLVQTAMLMEEVQKVYNLFPPTVKHPSPPALIICGDFNSLPDSGVYEFLSTGHVPKDHTDFKSYTYGSYTTLGISHKFQLKSAYQIQHQAQPANAATITNGVNALKECLDFTNLTPTFRGVIDYVWVGTTQLAVTGLLGNVDPEHVKHGCVGFPNAHHPSDHVPIMAAMRWKSHDGSTGGKKK